MRNKKIIRTLIASFALPLAFAVVCAGCKDGGQNDANDTLSPPIYAPEEVLELNYEYKKLAIYERFQLVVAEEGQAEFVSSAPTVASVDENGNVKALSQGTAIITVKLGDKSNECTVEVVETTSLPQVVLNTDKEMSLALGGTFTLAPTLQYNGSSVSDISFEYESSATGVITVENGVMQAVGYGTATITIRTTWETFDPLLTVETIMVSVVPDLNLTVRNHAELSIFSLEEVEGTSFVNEAELLYEVWLDGEKLSVSADEIVWENSDATIVELTGNTIRGLKAGTATIGLAYTFMENGEEYSVNTSVDVMVEKPVIEKSVELLVDAWLDGSAGVRDKTEITIDSATIFADGAQAMIIEDRTSNTRTYVVSGDRIDATTLDLGDRTWVVYNENYGVKVKARVASMIIKTAADLKIFSDLLENGEKFGYYMLGNSINYQGDQFGSGVDNYTEAFQGTFDGNGYSIYNIDVQTGFIRNLGVAGVLKDVALVQAFSTSTLGSKGGLTRFCYGTISNVYMEYRIRSASKTHRFAPIAYRIYEGGRIENCTLNVVDVDGTAKNLYSCAYAYDSYGAIIKNTTVIIPNISAADSTGPVFSEQPYIEKYMELENCAVLNNQNALSTKQKANNRFTSLGKIELSWEINLMGEAAMSANAPVVWTLEDGTPIDNAIVLAEEAKQCKVVATYLFDSSIKATATIDLVPAQFIELGGETSVLMEEDKKEYIVSIVPDLNVSEIRTVIFSHATFTKITDFEIDETNNTITLPKEVFAAGGNAIYLFTGTENYVTRYNFYHYEISTAEELYAFFTEEEFGKSGFTWSLTKDIDMSDYVVDGRTAQKTLRTSLDGKGYAIKNLTVTGYLIWYLSADIRDVRFENLTINARETQADTEDKMLTIVSRLGNGCELENLYIDMKVVGSGEQEAYISAVANTTNSGSSTNISLRNVVAEIEVEGCVVKSVSMIRVIQSHADSKVVMKNAYIAYMGTAVPVLVSKMQTHTTTASTKLTIINDGKTTIENGPAAGTQAAKDVMAGKQACVNTLNDVYAYRDDFLYDMWKDILVYDEELEALKYVKIGTLEEFKALIEELNGASDKSLERTVSTWYLLTADIDATGITMDASEKTYVIFSGVLDGGGHSISNLTLQGTDASTAFIHRLTGTIRNIRFENLQANSGNSAQYFGLTRLIDDGAVVENVYVDMHVTTKMGTTNIGIIAVENRAKACTVTIRNVVGKISVTKEGNAKTVNAGILYQVQASGDYTATVAMENVYLVDAFSEEGTQLPLVFRLYSKNNGVSVISLKNGTAETITETHQNDSGTTKSLATFATDAVYKEMSGLKSAVSAFFPTWFFKN